MPDESKTPENGRRYSVASLRHSLEVLDQFAQQESWSLSDLTARVTQPKSRIYRSLITFEECGYLQREPRTGRFRLGPRLAELSTASARYEQLRWRALPPLQALADATGETVNVGILFGGEAVTVQVVEGRHAVRMHCAVGNRSPAHCNSLGKAMMAQYPDLEIDAYIQGAELKRLTPNTIVDRAALKAHLRQVRDQGFAIDDEEQAQGLRCVAVPITDHTGLVVAAVSVAAPTTRLSLEGAIELAQQVKACARTISRMLGSPSLALHGDPPGDPPAGALPR